MKLLQNEYKDILRIELTLNQIESSEHVKQPGM